MVRKIITICLALLAISHAAQAQRITTNQIECGRLDQITAALKQLHKERPIATGTLKSGATARLFMGDTSWSIVVTLPEDDESYPDVSCIVMWGKDWKPLRTGSL